MRKSRVVILEEEIDECHNILEYQKIEQQIAMELNDSQALSDIGHMIVAMQKRLPILKKMLEQAQLNSLDLEPIDFQAIIQIVKR